MGDYTNINKDTQQRLSNDAKLKASFENLDQDKTLMKSLYNNYDSGELKGDNIDKSVFEEYINEASRGKAGISDDIDFMFNILDTDGDNKLSREELDVIKSYMPSDSKIDAHSIGNYFYSFDQNAIKEEIGVNKIIEEAKAGIIDMDLLEIIYEDKPETLAYIKEQIKNNDGTKSPENDGTKLPEEKVDKLVKYFDKIQETSESEIKKEDIKNELRKYYPDVTEDLIDGYADQIYQLLPKG